MEAVVRGFCGSGLVGGLGLLSSRAEGWQKLGGTLRSLQKRTNVHTHAETVFVAGDKWRCWG